MKISHADITLTWENGRKVHLGTIDIEADRKEFRTTVQFRQRLGWELIRKGFAVMFPGRTWKTEFKG